jgi:hypothetical protein
MAFAVYVSHAVMPVTWVTIAAPQQRIAAQGDHDRHSQPPR